MVEWQRFSILITVYVLHIFPWHSADGTLLLSSADVSDLLIAFS